jgi:hypothetical protein
MTALGTTVIVLHVGRIKHTYGAHLELVKLTRNADATIRESRSLIKSLAGPEIPLRVCGRDNAGGYKLDCVNGHRKNDT